MYEAAQLPTSEPLGVCDSHLRLGLVEGFLMFLCETRRARKASTLRTLAKAWRMAHHYHLRYPVPLTLKSGMKNYVEIVLIKDYNLYLLRNYKDSWGSDPIFDLAVHFWTLNNDWYPTERDRVQHHLMNIFSASTTARAGSVVESSCYYGTNEAVTYRDVRLFVLRDPSNEPEAANVKIYEADISNLGVLTECIRGPNALFLCIAEGSNKPKTRIAQDQVEAVVAALQRLRSNDKNVRLPTLVVLSTAGAEVEPKLSLEVPWLIRNVLFAANYHIYVDLIAAEKYLLTQDWLNVVYFKPGGIS